MKPLFILIVAALLIGGAYYIYEDQTESSVEKAGEAIESAADDAGNAVENATSD